MWKSLTVVMVALAASSKEQPLSPEAFKKKFEHVVTELRGGL